MAGQSCSRNSFPAPARTVGPHKHAKAAGPNRPDGTGSSELHALPRTQRRLCIPADARTCGLAGGASFGLIRSGSAGGGPGHSELAPPYAGPNGSGSGGLHPRLAFHFASRPAPWPFPAANDPSRFLFTDLQPPGGPKMGDGGTRLHKGAGDDSYQKSRARRESSKPTKGPTKARAPCSKGFECVPLRSRLLSLLVAAPGRLAPALRIISLRNSPTKPGST